MSSGFQLLEPGRLYNDEVVVGFFHPHLDALTQHQKGARVFDKEVTQTFNNMEKTIKRLKAQSVPVVFWGGTGKSAAFLNMFHITNDDFPLVVDSDMNKIGKYVPGMGQRIESPEILKNTKPIIVITTAWRAKDIYSDIKSRGLNYEQLLVLKGGDLNEYSEF
jgi:hypothetical protein